MNGLAAFCMVATLSVARAADESFAPESSWSFREEAFYAKDGFASGLIGPVTLGFPVEDSKLADRQWQERK